MNEGLQLLAIIVTEEADKLLVTVPIVIASIAIGVWAMRQFPPIKGPR